MAGQYRLLKHAGDVIMGVLADGRNVGRVGVVLCQQERLEGVNIVGQNGRQNKLREHFLQRRKRCLQSVKRHAEF